MRKIEKGRDDMYNERSKEYTIEYRKKKKEEVRIDVPKGMKEIYKKYAEKRGMSLAALIMYLMESEMERDGFYSAAEAAAQAEREKAEKVAAIKSEMKPPAKR